MKRTFCGSFAVVMLLLFNLETRADVPAPPPVECLGENDALQLRKNSVVLRNVRWRIASTGEYGCGHAISHREDTGHFWFFNSENIELTCKALDGRPLTGAYWVFCGALTDVEWWMDAVDNGNPENLKRYYNPPSRIASFADTAALSPGDNRVPLFNPQHCDATFVIRAGASGTVSVFVEDPDGDAVSANVRIVKDEGGGLVLTPRWTNPVAGAGTDLVFAFRVPSQAGEYVLEIQASDGKLLMPTTCRIQFIVHRS